MKLLLDYFFQNDWIKFSLNLVILLKLFRYKSGQILNKIIVCYTVKSRTYWEIIPRENYLKDLEERIFGRKNWRIYP